MQKTKLGPSTFIIVSFLLFNSFMGCKITEEIDETPKETIPFVIENLGVNFAKYDSTTGYAGDFYFDDNMIKMFGEFGGYTYDPQGNIKELPHFTYTLRSDAKIFAVSEGIVHRFLDQDGSGDYEFSIRSINDTTFDIGYDHMSNLQIAKGDTVKPGDFLGNPLPWPGQDLGTMEIMIVNTERRLAYCPFALFNEDSVDVYQQKVVQLMKDWEEFKGDTSIYDEENYTLPGCRYETMVTY